MRGISFAVAVIAAAASAEETDNAYYMRESPYGARQPYYGEPVYGGERYPMSQPRYVVEEPMPRYEEPMSRFEPRYESRYREPMYESRYHEPLMQPHYMQIPEEREYRYEPRDVRYVEVPSERSH